VLQLIKRYRELILVAVLLLVPLGVFFARAKRPADRTAVDRAVVWATAPIEKGVAWVVTGVLDGWRGYAALRGAQARAMAASREVNLLRLERLQLLEERSEVERLRRLLGFAQGWPGRTYVGARVIGVQLAPSGLQLLVIDRGEADGVVKMKPVAMADGVVGRVHSATAHTAEVLLLTDRNSSVAVRVDRTRARGNVRGLGQPGACKLDYALRAEDVVEGDALVTAGTDGVFPRGLPVGKVAQLRRFGNGLFQDAQVIPAVDVTRVEEVLVITAFEVPPPEPAPATSQATTTTTPTAAAAAPPPGKRP
jgi:rod shape-determining protein MreC